jgi:hypothetical protein
VVLVEEGKQRPEGTLCKDIVTAFRAVSRNVAECPDGLLSHVDDGRG